MNLLARISLAMAHRRNPSSRKVGARDDRPKMGASAPCGRWRVCGPELITEGNWFFSALRVGIEGSAVMIVRVGIQHRYVGEYES